MPVRTRLSVLAVVLALVTVPAAARAVIISGYVKSSSGGAPLMNVDLDWFNVTTGLDVDPLGDHTDATGFFSVSVPAGEYDITVNRPPALDHASVFLAGVDLTLSGSLGDILLDPGTTVTALVRDELGAPLVGIRFVFRDEDTGDEPFLTDENSSALGVFNDVVPFGTYRIDIDDPNGLHVPPFPLEEVVVGAPTDLGAIVMPIGADLTGTVVDTGAAGIFNVDLDVYDEATGTLINTTGDNTDFFGAYSVLVPRGSLRVEFTPSPGSPFAAEALDGVAVSDSTHLPPVTLQPGFSVTGLVLDAASTPFPAVDVDVIDVGTGRKRFVPGDFTDGAGAYAILLPAGTFDIVFNPPAGFALASGVLWNRVVTGAIGMPTVQLDPGMLVTGTVTGAGSPLAAVDLDLVVTATGKTYPTPADDTDAAGVYSVRVPAGTYDISADPGPFTAWSPKTDPGRVIGSATVVDFQLDPATTSVGGGSAVPPLRLRVYPNPFGTRAHILPNATDGALGRGGSLLITDVRGRMVRRLEVSGAGGVTWDGRDDTGAAVAPGVYFVVARDGGRSGTVRVVKTR